MEDEVATVQSTGQLLESTREVKHKIQNLVLQRDESILLEALPPRRKEIVFLSMTQQQAEEHAAVVEQAAEERLNTYATTSRLAAVLQKCKEGFVPKSKALAFQAGGRLRVESFRCLPSSSARARLQPGQ